MSFEVNEEIKYKKMIMLMINVDFSNEKANFFSDFVFHNFFMLLAFDRS